MGDLDIVVCTLAVALFAGLLLGLWVLAGIRLDVVRRRDEERRW